MPEKRVFYVLYDNRLSKFTGVSPKKAALKAAIRTIGTKDEPVEVLVIDSMTRNIYLYATWNEVINIDEKTRKKIPWHPKQTKKGYAEIIKKIKV